MLYKPSKGAVSLANELGLPKDSITIEYHCRSWNVHVLDEKYLLDAQGRARGISYLHADLPVRIKFRNEIVSK